MNPSPVPEHPVTRGLFLCDLVIVESHTGKVSIINTFDRFRCVSFPSVPKPFVVYAFLTDGSGDVDLTIEIAGLSLFEQVYSHTTRVQFPDRVAATHFRFTVTDCSFPRAGTYQVVLYANREPIAQTRIEVVG
jgi:hypothetical protein